MVRASLFGLLLMASATSAAAQEHAWMVVLDFRPGGDGTPVLSAPARTSDGTIRACADSIFRDPGPPRLDPRQDDARWISQRGDTLVVLTIYPAGQDHPTLLIQEVKRESRLTTDIRKLVQLAAIIGLRAVPDDTLPRCAVRRHKLTEERATLGITAASGGDSLSTRIVTGPREHWYLSADVPLRRGTVFKYDPAQDAFVAEKPSAFYVGINFLVGDLLSESRGAWEDFGVKALVKASSRPLDSYGVALTWRGDLLDRYGLDFDLIAPYVAWLSDLEDQEGDEAGDVVRGRTSNWVAGISFNLDTALGWVGGGS